MPTMVIVILVLVSLVLLILAYFKERKALLVVKEYHTIMEAYEQGLAFSDKQIALLQVAISESATTLTDDYIAKIKNGEIQLPETLAGILQGTSTSAEPELERAQGIITQLRNELSTLQGVDAQLEQYRGMAAKVADRETELLERIKTLEQEARENEFQRMTPQPENVSEPNDSEAPKVIAELHQQIQGLRSDVEGLTLKLTESGEQLSTTVEEHAKVLAEANRDYEARIEQIKADYESKLTAAAEKQTAIQIELQEIKEVNKELNAKLALTSNKEADIPQAVSEELARLRVSTMDLETQLERARQQAQQSAERGQEAQRSATESKAELTAKLAEIEKLQQELTSSKLILEALASILSQSKDINPVARMHYSKWKSLLKIEDFVVTKK